MRTTSKSWRGLLAAGLLAAVATQAAAQLSTTANGPYYATPSWDQKLTVNRFVILANWDSAAVLDRETGLVWERSPSTVQRNWLLASQRCNNLGTGGRRGWRLPGSPELASLVDPTVASPGPTLPAGHPFLDVQSSNYWTGTAVADVDGGAFALNFQIGFLSAAGKSTSFYVWCVRGGQGSDAQ